MEFETFQTVHGHVMRADCDHQMAVHHTQAHRALHQDSTSNTSSQHSKYLHIFSIHHTHKLIRHSYISNHHNKSTTINFQIQIS